MPSAQVYALEQLPEFKAALQIFADKAKDATEKAKDVAKDATDKAKDAADGAADKAKSAALRKRPTKSDEDMVNNGRTSALS